MAPGSLMRAMIGRLAHSRRGERQRRAALRICHQRGVTRAAGAFAPLRLNAPVPPLSWLTDQMAQTVSGLALIDQVAQPRVFAAMAPDPTPQLLAKRRPGW